MIKIALLGAPGSGKSKLARSLSRKLDDVGIVDGYVDKLTKLTTQKYGANTSFVQEIQVLGARWAAEDAAIAQHTCVITCGTIYESIIYASSVQPWAHNEQTLLEDHVYIQTVMSALGAMATKTFDYHALFYLPWESEGEHSWESVVNAKIPEVLNGLGLAYVTLTGTNKQKVERVTEFIAPLIVAPTEDEQPTV
jgi:energy-coupling factor transporter ATP-binding protein EcfA2